MYLYSKGEQSPCSRSSSSQLNAHNKTQILTFHTQTYIRTQVHAYTKISYVVKMIPLHHTLVHLLHTMDGINLALHLCMGISEFSYQNLATRIPISPSAIVCVYNVYTCIHTIPYNHEVFVVNMANTKTSACSNMDNTHISAKCKLGCICNLSMHACMYVYLYVCMSHVTVCVFHSYVVARWCLFSMIFVCSK